MVIRKIDLVKKTGEDVVTYHPTSSADVITYEQSLSVGDVLDAIVDSVEQIENRLSSKSVYMVNSSGEVMTDASGIGLVELL